MMYMILGEKNYIGPVQEVLALPSHRPKEILDIGTGTGDWCVVLSRPLCRHAGPHRWSLFPGFTGRFSSRTNSQT